MRCTFFGHRDSPESIQGDLRELLIFLIERERVDTFYVGNHGQFDRMVKSHLEELAIIYPNIAYFIVLAYLPRNNEYQGVSIFPEGIESTLPRFAILKRNAWMIENSDYVVAYVTRCGGNSARFLKSAVRKGKTVYNIADNYSIGDIKQVN